MHNTELYDLQADPGETTHIIPAPPGVVAELRAACDQWRNEVPPLLQRR